jgi:hypothetical protein
MPKLFFDIKEKNKINAREIRENKIVRYKFKLTKDRNNTPNKNPKQIV